LEEIQSLKLELKHLHLIDKSDNDQNAASTIGEQKYSAAGTLETVQENIISTRNAEIQIRQESESRAARELINLLDQVM
jgi:hypothetical protein